MKPYYEHGGVTIYHFPLTVACDRFKECRSQDQSQDTSRPPSTSPSASGGARITRSGKVVK